MSEPTIPKLKKHLFCLEPANVTIQQLRQHIPEFLKHLDLSIMVPALREAALLNEDEEWHLTNCDQSPRERILHLLTFIIARKGNEGPNMFIDCIRRASDCHSGHRRLVRLFCSKFMQCSYIQISRERSMSRPPYYNVLEMHDTNNRKLYSLIKKGGVWFSTLNTHKVS